jgi:glycosyltransferase involved in cell wall biosynthesis
VLLSIIIPTHERASYAHQTVTQILTNMPQTEVVIADTSAIDPWTGFGRDWRDQGRLKVVRPGTGMSVVDNFNAGAAAASGDWSVFIGDDDFVIPQLEEIIASAQEDGTDAIKFTFADNYYWPDYQHRAQPALYAGTLWRAPFSGRQYPYDAIDARRQALARLGHGVLDMPRAYQPQ